MFFIYMITVFFFFPLTLPIPRLLSWGGGLRRWRLESNLGDLSLPWASALVSPPFFFHIFFIPFFPIP